MLLLPFAAILLLTPNLAHSQAPSTTESSDTGGLYNTACNAGSDCQAGRGLLCLQHTCLCPYPQVYDLRLGRCIIPLGKQCDNSNVLNGESLCPEFGECFMNRCVCKTGHSMHTLTRCKSDLLETPGERKPIVLWPRGSSSSISISKVPTPSPSKGQEKRSSCSSSSCDSSKGLSCQNGGCKCKDSNEIFVDEFDRCLNATLQSALKDAIRLVSTSEGENQVKKFMTLFEMLGKEVDQRTGNSDYYKSPIHLVLRLLGGGNEPSSDYSSLQRRSHVAQPSQSYMMHEDTHHAAQETVTETTKMSSTEADTEGSEESEGSRHDEEREPGKNILDPNHQAANEGGNEDGGGTGGKGLFDSGHSEPPTNSGQGSSGPYLENFNFRGQDPVLGPGIVQRQAPQFYQGHGHGHGHGGYPIQGIGSVPQNHYRSPFSRTLGGLGNVGNFGGYAPEGYGGQLVPGYGGGYPGGLGAGYGGGVGGYAPAYAGGALPDDGLSNIRFKTLFKGPPPQPPPPPPSLARDLGEFVQQCLKLMDRFLPLIQTIQDALKRGIKGGQGQGRVGRQGEFGEDVGEDLKEGGILQGVVKFMSIVLQLKKRIAADPALKKLLS